MSAAAAPALPGLAGEHPGDAALPAASAEPAKPAPPSYFADRVDRRAKPLGHRAGGDHGDVHGGARHQHRQRLLAAHRRRSLGEHGREHLGAHLVPGRQRHRAAHQRVAGQQVRAQALLHDVRGAVHHQLACSAGWRPRCRGWSSSASSRASAAAGLGPSEQSILADTFPPAEARAGVRHVRHGGGAGAGHRAHAGRLHHRPLLVALGVLHQRAGGDPLDVPHLAHGHRPAARGGGGQARGRAPRRLRRPRRSSRWGSARWSWSSTRGRRRTGSTPTSSSAARSSRRRRSPRSSSGSGHHDTPSST